MTGLPESGRAISSSTTGRRYVVITPARNEESHLPGLIASMEKQTVRPARWIIVDDGSTDNTVQKMESAAAAHTWIHMVLRSDRGRRVAGAGVMEAVKAGLDELRVTDWEYLVKLDADLSFEADYFARCFARFDADDRLGIGGGTVCVLRQGEPAVEVPGDPPFHVRGATKIYRRACWDRIGGLVASTGWDTIDELMANYQGWRTETFKDIPLIQHRETGRAGPVWSDWVKNGRANYLTGYHPLFMFLKCGKRLFKSANPLNAFGLAWGYVSAWARRLPRPVEAEFVRYVRREQMNCLLGRPSLWSRHA